MLEYQGGAGLVHGLVALDAQQLLPPSTSQTTGRARSTIRLADLMFCAWF